MREKSMERKLGTSLKDYDAWGGASRHRRTYRLKYWHEGSSSCRPRRNAVPGAGKSWQVGDHIPWHGGRLSRWRSSPPATPSQLPKQEMQQQIEPAPVPPDPFGALARGSPRQVSSPSHVTVTAILPAALYEQLQQEAQRRRVSMTAMLREAVEAYTQSHMRED
jgi:hypothetical protein